MCTQVAEALFHSGASRSPSSNNLSGSSTSPIGSDTARLPHRRGSVPLFAALTPTRSSPRHLAPPSLPRRELRTTKSSPEVRKVSPSSTRKTVEDSSSDEDETWHDAEEEFVPPTPRRASMGATVEPRTWEMLVRPSSRAALEWSSMADGTRGSLSAVAATFLSTSPPLSPKTVLTLDPFADPNASTLSLELEVYIEDELLLPFPIQPVASTLPPSRRLSASSNFYSAPPCELRKSWRREQRLSAARTSRAVSPVEMGEVDGALLGDVAGGQQSFTSSRPGFFHRIPLGPLPLLPLGAWLFAAGFLLPFCWWIGAFYRSSSPNRPSSTLPARLEEVKVASPSPLGSDGHSTAWRDLRPAWEARRGRLSRLLEGRREGPYEIEASDWVWRRRNRVMSGVSVVLLGVCGGVGVWAGLGARRG